MLPSWTRIALWTCIALPLLAATAGAAEYRVLLDLDNNPATGCDVATVEGTFAGVEQILVTTTAGTVVVDVATRDCVDPDADLFAPPLTLDPGGWPVGVGRGVDASDVVETYLPATSCSVVATAPRY